MYNKSVNSRAWDDKVNHWFPFPVGRTPVHFVSNNNRCLKKKLNLFTVKTSVFYTYINLKCIL